MQNTAQLKALGMILEGASVLAFGLYKDARNAETEEKIDGLGDVLGKIFGQPVEVFDGKGVQPEQPEKNTGSTGEASAPAEVVATTDAAPANTLDQVLALLNDERYTLRSFSSIEDKTGLTQGEVEALLDDNDIPYVLKSKRGSRVKTLIGLAARN